MVDYEHNRPLFEKAPDCRNNCDSGAFLSGKDGIGAFFRCRQVGAR